MSKKSLQVNSQIYGKVTQDMGIGHFVDLSGALQLYWPKIHGNFNMYSDYGILALPFEECWIEARVPPHLLRENAIGEARHKRVWAGVAASMLENKDGMLPSELHLTVLNVLVKKIGAAISREVLDERMKRFAKFDRQGISIKYVVSLAGHTVTDESVYPVGMLLLFLDEHGYIVGTINDMTHLVVQSEQDYLGVEKGFVEEATVAFYQPFLYGISIMNSRNVKVVSEPRKRRPAKAKTPGDKLVFKSLKVTLPRRSYPGQSEESGSTRKHKLHWVRGGFRKYGGVDENGQPRGLLFGKYATTLYIPAHMRGDPNLGEVIKDWEFFDNQEQS